MAPPYLGGADLTERSAVEKRLTDMKKQKSYYRFFTVLCTILMMLGCMAITASASTGSYLDAMNDKIIEWYKTIRKIAVLLLMLSFASCGFKIMSCVFMSKGEFAADAAKKQAFYSVLALLVLVLLPSIIMMGSDMFRATAWKPPTSSSLFPGTTQPTIP